MDLRRSWLAGAARASAVSAVVAITLFGAVVFVAVGGGTGGLSSLTQLVEGPSEAPDVGRAGADLASSEALVAVPGPALPAPSAGAPRRRPAAGRAPDAGTVAPPAGTGSPRRPGREAEPGPAPAPGPAQQPAGGTADRPPPASPNPGVVQGVRDALRPVTGMLPDEVARPVDETLDEVVRLCGQLSCP